MSSPLSACRIAFFNAVISFDRIIIKEDEDKRGRDAGEVAKMLMGWGVLTVAHGEQLLKYSILSLAE